jgi:hypothetical protein
MIYLWMQIVGQMRLAQMYGSIIPGSPIVAHLTHSVSDRFPTHRSRSGSEGMHPEQMSYSCSDLHARLGAKTIAQDGRGRHFEESVRRDWTNSAECGLRRLQLGTRVGSKR